MIQSSLFELLSPIQNRILLELSFTDSIQTSSSFRRTHTHGIRNRGSKVPAKHSEKVHQKVYLLALRDFELCRGVIPLLLLLIEILSRVFELCEVMCISNLFCGTINVYITIPLAGYACYYCFWYFTELSGAALLFRERRQLRGIVRVRCAAVRVMTSVPRLLIR